MGFSWRKPPANSQDCFVGEYSLVLEHENTSKPHRYCFRSSLGEVISWKICTAQKEGQFAALDPVPNFRKKAAFEDGLGKPKPLREGHFSSFVGRKYQQDGTVEHYCTILKGKIARNDYAYWLLALLDVLFSGDFQDKYCTHLQ